VVCTPFAVINADDFYGRSAYRALSHHLENAQDGDGVYDYCMVGYRLENTLTEHGHVARGICDVDPDGYLVEVQERTRIERFGQVARYAVNGGYWVELAMTTSVSMNCWGFTPSLFSELAYRFPRFLQENKDDIQNAEFFLPEVVGALVQEGRARVKVLPASDRWFGVTYQQDRPWVKQAVRDLIRRDVYPEVLWEKPTQ
jgi:hypothetical protein